MPLKQDRMTLVLNINHEHLGADPFGIQAIAVELLTVEEQPYQRRFRATEAWKPLDLGWLDENQAGLVFVENLEGKGLETNPSEEEKKWIADRIVEISYDEDPTKSDVVPPGRFYLGFPSQAALLKIRCRSETAQCRITVLSK